jgi:hypothetical protein
MSIIDVIHTKKVTRKKPLANDNAILEYYFNSPLTINKAINTELSNNELSNNELSNTKLSNTKLSNTNLSNTNSTAHAFNIPNIKEFNKLLTTNYKVNELKIIQKYYKIKCVGNKEYLKKYLYNYLFYSCNIITIQKNVRGYLIKKYIKFHGPAFYKRNLCSNDVDFCTLDDLNSIPYNQFISFKDENNHIYGFDIISLYTLFKNGLLAMKKTNNNITSESFIDIENPFTKQKFNANTLKQLINYINISRILKIIINLEYDELVVVSDSKQVEMKILTLFQKIDSLGNYTNIKWFSELDKKKLIRFIRELMDIWNYRANLSYEVKREIVPQRSDPFFDRTINLNMLGQYSFIQLRKYCVTIIDILINSGINTNSCSLGSYYVLCALTIVSQDAADALPWLYEATVH